MQRLSLDAYGIFLIVLAGLLLFGLIAAPAHMITLVGWTLLVAAFAAAAEKLVGRSG